jgi:hypothetical protein
MNPHPENDGIGTIINYLRLTDAVFVTIATPLHSIVHKALCIQNYASMKFLDKHLEITAAHTPDHMVQYKEEDFQRLFQTVFSNRSLT